MLQFILKLFQPVIRKGNKQLDALVGGLRVADFVRLQRGQIILLLRLRWNGKESRRNREQAQTERSKSIHGDTPFPVAGLLAAGFFSFGWRGNNKSSSSSSMAARSRRTISKGGRYSSGATTRTSSTSRSALCTWICNCLNPLVWCSASRWSLFSASTAARALSRYFSITNPIVL